MIVAEVTESGIVAVVTSLAAAAMGAYALYRRTKRNEDASDAEQERKDIEAEASLWRRQYEEKCKSDERFNARIESQLADLYTKYQYSEKLHAKCLEEHAGAHAELQLAKARIAELERLVCKA